MNTKLTTLVLRTSNPYSLLNTMFGYNNHDRSLSTHAALSPSFSISMMVAPTLKKMTTVFPAVSPTATAVVSSPGSSASQGLNTIPDGQNALMGPVSLSSNDPVFLASAVVALAVVGLIVVRRSKARRSISTEASENGGTAA